MFIGSIAKCVFIHRSGCVTYKFLLVVLEYEKCLKCVCLFILL